MGPHHSIKTEYLAFWLNGASWSGDRGSREWKGLQRPWHPASDPPCFAPEPHFVGSAYVPESVGSFTGDDDKVYFFFSERAVEYDCYAEQVVARVARVCKVPSSAAVGGGSPEGWAGADQPPCLLATCQGDMGGARTLQKKWTTFLKAQLVCSAPEWKVYFNQLRAVHTLLGTSWHNTTFFGVFQARW